MLEVELPTLLCLSVFCLHVSQTESKMLRSGLSGGHSICYRLTVLYDSGCMFGAAVMLHIEFRTDPDGTK